MIDLRQSKKMSQSVLDAMRASIETDERQLVANLYEKASRFFKGDGDLVITSGQGENIATIMNTILNEKGRCKMVCSILDDFSVLTALMPPEVEIEYIGVDSDGKLLEGQYLRALEEKPDLVILTAVNEETGVRINISKYAAKAKVAGATVFVDATHAAGYMDMGPVPKTIDFLGVNTNAFGGPPASGFIWCNTGKLPEPLFSTHNPLKDINCMTVAGIAATLEQSALSRDFAVQHTRELRDALDQNLSRVDGITVNCWNTERVSNISNYNFEGVNSRELYNKLKDLDILTMCSSKDFEELDKASPLMHGIHTGASVHGNLRIQIHLHVVYEDIVRVYTCIERIYTELRKCTRVQKGYTHVR